MQSIRPWIPDYGNLVRHHPTYNMVTCRRKEIKTFKLYFHAFYNKYKVFIPIALVVVCCVPEQSRLVSYSPPPPCWRTPPPSVAGQEVCGSEARFWAHTSQTYWTLGGQTFFGHGTDSLVLMHPQNHLELETVCKRAFIFRKYLARDWANSLFITG